MMRRISRSLRGMRSIALSTILILGVCLSTTAYGQDKKEVKAEFPCPIDADLWLMGGQSNMDGQDHAKKYPTTPDPKIMAFDMTNEWMVAKEPVTRVFEAKAAVHQNFLRAWMASSTTDTAAAQKLFEAFRGDLRNNPRGVGPGVAFAQVVLKETGRPIGLIPCSHGGSGMDSWNPALKDKGDESLYGAMMNRVKMVGGGKKIKGLLWYQGESEVGSPESINNFEKNFLNIIDCLRRDLDQPDLPVLYVQIGRWVRDDAKLALAYEQIREHQRLVSTKRKNIYFTTAIDQTLYDPIHVSGSGEQCLGRRLAELALTYVYNKPGHARQIDLESVTVPDPKAGFPVIHLKFSGVSGSAPCAQSAGPVRTARRLARL